LKVFPAAGGKNKIKNFHCYLCRYRGGMELLMDFIKLTALRDEYNKKRAALSEAARESFERSFDIIFAHNSTAIEGNTLSLIETKAVLEDGISIGGKTLREIYEVTNHDRAFSYVKLCISEGKPLSESIMKDIHYLLTEKILSGGIYRNTEVRITGASHKPPVPALMFDQIKAFFDGLPEMSKKLNTIELAAYTHAEFVKIHPFPDGNGRTARLIMNYQLMRDSFPPVSIAKENRLAYFEALESYAVGNDLSPFSEMLAGLLENIMSE
jgi:Fic family protein